MSKYNEREICVVENRDVFDVLNWKPITPEKLVEELGAIFLHTEELDQATFKLHDTAYDGTTLRLVCEAVVRVKDATRDSEPVVEQQPYLMLIVRHDERGGAASKPVIMMRTDVTLEVV